MVFTDRYDAARKLAKKLRKYANKKDVLILAIPRGALEIGCELSRVLKVPLSIVVSKKIGSPLNDEYAIGAVGPNGDVILNKNEAMNITEKYLQNKIKELVLKIKMRYENYTLQKEMPDVKNKTVIVVDDGIAVGFTMLACLKYLNTEKPKKIVVAVPVSSRDGAQKVAVMTDEFICLSQPLMFMAVGQFYREFHEVTDEQAMELLQKANKEFNNTKCQK